VKPEADPARLRWLVLGVFVLSTAINFLDRQALSALSPLVRSEFHLTGAEYGWIVAACAIAYGASAPFAGMLIDRIGLNRAISYAVGLWSCAGIATGFTTSLGGLVGCRAVLGAAEAAGIPAAGKAIHQYLRPAERALGNALNQGGVSLGMVAAPPLATWLAVNWGWRRAFIVTGVLGLAWIPVWRWMSGVASTVPAPKPDSIEVLRDRRLWIFIAANGLSMIPYVLWTYWTTLYLVDVHRLTLVQSAWYAWIPPVFATAGGIAGGWLSLRLIHRNIEAPAARFRACVMASVLSLGTAAIPAMPTPAWAAAGISLSFFAVAAFSVNMYTLPLDVFGGAHAAFTVSTLTASVGAIAALISPPIGWTIDHWGYVPVVYAAAVMPLLACGVLRWRVGFSPRGASAPLASRAEQTRRR
jgi:ACS family hexuronate transporter-like MFS transporter